MNAPLRNYIESVHQLAVRASLNYDIWWVYKSKDTRPLYTRTLNEYLSFFSSSIHAHFVAHVVAMYALYETRKDTYNIPRLVQQIKKEPTTSTVLIKEIDTLLAEAKAIWIKVGVLRNEVFAHLAESKTSADAFQKAGVKPNELARLLKLSKSILNLCRRSIGESPHEFNLSAREDTLRLLGDLKAKNDG